MVTGADIRQNHTKMNLTNKWLTLSQTEHSAGLSSNTAQVFLRVCGNGSTHGLLDLAITCRESFRNGIPACAVQRNKFWQLNIDMLLLIGVRYFTIETNWLCRRGSGTWLSVWLSGQPASVFIIVVCVVVQQYEPRMWKLILVLAPIAICYINNRHNIPTCRGRL